MASGGSPFHYPILQGDIEIVKELLEAGADVNLKANEAKPPLHMAA